MAVAVHAGHCLRDDVASLVALEEPTRLMEEDPHTDRWTALAPTRLVARRSRFEVDLNRSRDHAVYLRPDDAWGLDLWREEPAADVVSRSREVYDTFYAVLEAILTRAERAFGRFVVYDLHSYNHRRAGPDAAPADPAGNPDVNLGTGAMDRSTWAGVVDHFVGDLRAADLDVRENVRFRGGHLGRWIHERFPDSGCALAIDVKKFFMDEHTGEVDERRLVYVGDALAATVPGVVEELFRS